MMSTDTNNEADEVRRSERKRISNIIKIDGHDVLRKNNYVLKGGSYIMGAHVADAVTVQQHKEKKPRIDNNNTTRTTRAVAPHEIARVAFNDCIKKSIQDKEQYRRNFIVQNFKLLEPFMDIQTNRIVRQWSQNDKVVHHKKDLFVQPDRVEGGEMRDYQLAGLNFMVNMHQQNLGMILGDEMGL
jgi:SNF2 family DNA or RNA helicase